MGEVILYRLSLRDCIVYGVQCRIHFLVVLLTAPRTRRIPHRLHSRCPARRLLHAARLAADEVDLLVRGPVAGGVHVSLAVHFAESSHEVLEYDELDSARMAHVPEGGSLGAAGACVCFPSLIEGTIREHNDTTRLEGAVGRLHGAY